LAQRPFTDPYTYPGTDTLKNRLGIRDPALLHLAEYAVTRRREMSAPALPLTAEGFKAAHRHLFQDLYPWAGQVRTVNLHHPQAAMRFALPHLVDGALAKQFQWLAAEGNLAGLGAAAFAAKAAHHVGELNAIHAFRDGNGRTMRLHLKQLAARAGHQLDPTRLPAQVWNDASNVSFHAGNNQPLAAVIEQGLRTRREVSEVETARTAATLSADGRLMYAAWAEKIERQMTKLSVEQRAELRAQVARDLVEKEEREGPVVLTPETRRLATAQEPSAEPQAEKREHDEPRPPTTPRRRR
jgi:fido (protein-threonine AMPylation protein)